MPYDVPVHQSTKVELIVDGQVRTLTPIRARPCELAAIRRRFSLSTASHPSGARGDGHEASGEVFARTAIQPYPPVALAGDDAEVIVLDFVQPLATGRQF